MVEMLSAEQIIANAVPAEPARSGIYFLINQGRIVYVGQATHIVARIATHIRDGFKLFDSWSWITCARDLLTSTERAYLNAFLPQENMDPVTRRLRGDVLVPAQAPIPENPWASITPEQWAAMRLTDEDVAEQRDEMKARMRRLREIKASLRK